MSEKNRALVSVILPTYNRGIVIQRAIDSVINQSYMNLELIIVDDGSEDDTKNIVNAYHDKRIHYKRSSKNRGVSFARNVGIRFVKGEYIAFQDSDDEWMLDKLEKQVDLLESHDNEWGMVYSMFLKEFSPGEFMEYPSKTIPFYKKTGNIFELLLQKNLIGTPTILVRRKILEEMEGFNENLKNLEDYELVLRIAKKYKIDMIEENLAKAYTLGDGIDMNPLFTIFSMLLIEKEFREDLGECGIREKFSAGIAQYAERLGLEKQIKALLLINPYTK